MQKTTKQERLEIVNQVIESIASRSRKFFYHDGRVAKMILINGRIYMTSEWHGEDMPIQTRFGQEPKRWHHGGTLWALTRDFAEFIRKGGQTNGNNGYGGLYCSHWGYS